MCDSLGSETWSNPKFTILDPCCGKGNMPAVLVKRFMSGLSEFIPDEKERYKHIMEKQIYMGELQMESAMEIDRIFNPDGDLKLNLFVGDSLKMPKDFFDLPFDERVKKYPQHHVNLSVKEDIAPLQEKPFVSRFW